MKILNKKRKNNKSFGGDVPVGFGTGGMRPPPPLVTPICMYVDVLHPAYTAIFGFPNNLKMFAFFGA